jgi:hypothetical protein
MSYTHEYGKDGYFGLAPSRAEKRAAKSSLALTRMRLKTIKRDQVFFEEDYGCVVKLRAIEDAREVSSGTRNGHECRAQVVSGKAATADEYGVVTLFECLNPGAYGLRLYPLE